MAGTGTPSEVRLHTQGEGSLLAGGAGMLQGCARQNAVWHSYPYRGGVCYASNTNAS